VTQPLKEKGLVCDNVLNYRPISNSYTICKMAERLFISYLIFTINHSAVDRVTNPHLRFDVFATTT